MFEALEYPFFVRALVAGLLASIAGGVIGTYVVVKRIASISGGLAHAAFGGVGLGYLLGFNPTVGAAGFGLLSGIGIGVAHHRLRGGLETVIAMVWALGMALGILFIALTPGYAPDLMSYLFGSILFVPADYLWIVAGLDLVILAVAFLLSKELKAVVFDEEFARVTGVPVEGVFLTLLALTSLTVVTLIRVVGVILVIALLTVPPSIARHWSNGLRTMMFMATLIGAACSTVGLFAAYWLSDAFSINVPTGPLIILIALAAYVVSFLTKSIRSRRQAEYSTGNVAVNEARN